jgi:carboxypeptidase C (cathepsin A)
MRKHIPRCEKLLRAAYEYDDTLIGDVAVQFCDEKFAEPYFESGLNYYDISKPCDGELCYPIENAITKYLNTQAIRDALGVPSSVHKFAACSNKVGRAYNEVRDGLYPTIGEVAFLLESGLRILMYVGTYDWICNFVGNER